MDCTHVTLKSTEVIGNIKWLPCLIMNKRLEYYPLRTCCYSSSLLEHSYLFLPQDYDASGFDGVPGCEVFTISQLLSILVGLPLAITCGPGDADVVPTTITYIQRQLGHLQLKDILLTAY